jgi:hypothetical protein
MYDARTLSLHVNGGCGVCTDCVLCILDIHMIPRDILTSVMYALSVCLGTY